VLRPEDLLADESIDLVVNLTIPKVHAEVSLSILEAGKHVYTEKPLATCVADGKRILDSARSRQLLVGGAPDTFLGAGIQTCKDLIAQGAIGKPIGGSANMLCPGHEGWHPNPAFYYAPGGGPVFDMGPYYLTALVELLGGIAETASFTSKGFNERIVGSGPEAGKHIPVQVQTHVAGLLRFQSGPIVTLTMSFDVQSSTLPNIELWGTEGSLLVPDPNTFGGPVLLKTRGSGTWKEMPLTHMWAQNSRGLGVSDMAGALLEGSVPRANGDRCFHVLQIMEQLAEGMGLTR